MCGHELSLRCKEVRIWALLCLTELNNTSNPRPSVTRVVMYTFSKIIGQQYQKDAVNHKPSDWGGRLSTSPCYCHGHLGRPVKTLSHELHPWIFLQRKVGNSVRCPCYLLKYLFGTTLPFKLQGFTARSRHLYVELCARANMLKFFWLIENTAPNYTQWGNSFLRCDATCAALQGGAPGPSVCSFFCPSCLEIPRWYIPP